MSTFYNGVCQVFHDDPDDGHKPNVLVTIKLWYIVCHTFN